MKGGEKMKQSELSMIVNSIAQEEHNAIYEKIKECRDSDDPLVDILTVICNELPAISARTTAEILLASGLITLDPE